MFEKRFGGKKEKYDSENTAIPGVEKISKIETAHADEEGVLINSAESYNGDEAYEMQEDFDKDDINAVIKKGKINWYWDEPKNAKSLNERKHPKLGERNSGIPRGENLVEEHSSSQEISDEHLDALMEQEENAKFIRDNFYPEGYDDHDEQDEDQNKAA